MKKTTGAGAILGRIICTLLAALMLAGLFLPSLKTPSPSDYLTDVYGQISGGQMSSVDRTMNAVIGDAFDSGTAREILQKFSRLNKSKLGAPGGFSYDYSEADQAIKDIHDQLNSDYYSEMMELNEYLRVEDTRSARSALSRLLSRDHFQDLYSRMLYATVIASMNSAQRSGANINTKSVVSQMQGITRYLGTEEVTPFALSMISLRLGLLTNQPEAVKAIMGTSDSDMDAPLSAANVACFVFLGLHVLFAVMVICALVGAILGKRRLVKVTAIIATVLAVLALLLVLLVRWLAPAVVPSLGMDAALEGVLSSGAVFPKPTFWMPVVAVAGILICVITNHVWKRQPKAAAPVIPAEEPVIPVTAPVAPVAAPVTPVAAPVAPVVERTVPVQEPVIPAEEPVIPAEEPVIPVQESVIPAEEPVIPVEEPEMPGAEEPVIPLAEEAAAPSVPNGSWVCSCGAVCDAGAKFCTVCGARRPESAPENTWTCECGSTWDKSAKFCVKCGRKQPEAQSVCAVCGAPLHPDQNFCLKCGAPVHAVRQD